jgi:threonine dehydrogenase-like Zn-dependent dehydrogenase
MNLPETMCAGVLTGHGGLDKLKYHRDWPTPRPAPGEVLVRVGACGLNNTDIITRTAWYSKSVTEGITDVELATYPCAYTTAENLVSRSALRPGENVVIAGASGGVGSAAIQLCRLRGARVIAIASPAKSDLLEQLGADQIIDRDDADVEGAIAGPLVEFDLRQLVYKDLQMTGATIVPACHHAPAAQPDRAGPAQTAVGAFICAPGSRQGAGNVHAEKARRQHCHRTMKIIRLCVNHKTLTSITTAIRLRCTHER